MTNDEFIVDYIINNRYTKAESFYVFYGILKALVENTPNDLTPTEIEVIREYYTPLINQLKPAKGKLN